MNNLNRYFNPIRTMNDWQWINSELFHPHIRERAHTRHTHETSQRVVVLCEFILWTQSEYTYKIIGDLIKEKGLKNREEKRKKGIFGG